MNIRDFALKKSLGEKISVITCYDAWSAAIIAETNIDCVLVGDSLAMVMHGHPNTIPASVDMMALHTSAVARSTGKKFIIGDMPFLSHRKGLKSTMDAVEKLMLAGAHAIKVERAEGDEKLLRHIILSGVPVIVHLGMTPQSVMQFGGFQVQAKKDECAQELINHARKLEELGCFALVLECIPEPVAAEITNAVRIPTIGIGAGRYVDGQVLVLHDMLGFNTFKPKFLKKYLDGLSLIKDALNQYDSEVKEELFPTEEHAY
ncbi:MAG: 3-methyl-2-oxobutanoate hydroxymethyltransferase [Gammaproteobacteria bacterium]